MPNYEDLISFLVDRAHKDCPDVPRSEFDHTYRYAFPTWQMAALAASKGLQADGSNGNPELRKAALAAMTIWERAKIALNGG